MGATDEQQREQQQRPETPAQRAAREREAQRVAAYELQRENDKVIRALRSNSHLWAFALDTVHLRDRASDVGGNGMGNEPPVGPLAAPVVAYADRVNLCRRVNQLVAEGVGYVVIPQTGPRLKEDAR